VVVAQGGEGPGGHAAVLSVEAADLAGDLHAQNASTQMTNEMQS
jgi:hypothetical protein